MVTELLRAECEFAGARLSEAESTLLALGIHADTGDTSCRVHFATRLAFLSTVPALIEASIEESPAGVRGGGRGLHLNTIALTDITIWLSPPRVTGNGSATFVL